MAAEMKDLRTKITDRTDAVLEAETRATGRDRAEITREILDGWAAQKIHAASLIMKLTKAEGAAGE